MSTWVLASFIVIGILFLIKMTVAASIVSVLKITEGAMFHPSAKIRVKTFLDATPMTPQDTLIDIGCGDGRVLREAWKRYRVRALGYEVNFLVYALAKIRNFFASGVRISYRNFWKEDISPADIVFCYLFPDVMERLAKKLGNELRPGTRVVSCNFAVPGWKPHCVLNPNSFFHSGPIYCYRFPEAIVSKKYNGEIIISSEKDCLMKTARPTLCMPYCMLSCEIFL